MRIEQVSLRLLKMKLKQPFVTALETVNERKIILVEVKAEGETGYGECLAFETPWYTEETIESAYTILSSLLIPRLLRSTIEHPRDVHQLFQSIKGNQMAKASIEMAVWDLYAKLQKLPLWRVMGGSKKEYHAEAVIAASNTAEALDQAEQFLNEGYSRIKVKISPQNGLDVIKQIKARFPLLDILADANSSFTLDDIPILKEFDTLGLLMIEQPLDACDIVQHRHIQAIMNTPICLDESISSLLDVKSAWELNSCNVINIKISRLGGVTEAINVHDYCVKNGLEVWCGGMIEFGVSRAFNLALSTLDGFTIPGDIVSSSRYWEEDIVLPEIVVENGWAEVTEQPGIGYEINLNRVQEITIRENVYTLD
ncbi:O-succinylbenzoate synthase [Bacillus coahuilensis m2-6]|uniref:o-succinylbenzoate synthase n=1 Tax=Bacillus coahuilensis TaxID=408580 RepID=UPI00075019B0|nr:o-succinylbenzoate synthase [Bacillus coahuilensis]KUP06350.1 O-succinylbenzoate synthase [Bacillus coahuilensis m2-6]